MQKKNTEQDKILHIKGVANSLIKWVCCLVEVKNSNCNSASYCTDNSNNL